MKPSTHEHELEDWACARFAEMGCVCLKFISPVFPGVPDRILLTDTGKVVFIEFKAPGQKPKRTQPQVLKMLTDMGHKAMVIDTRAQIQTIIDAIKGGV